MKEIFLSNHESDMVPSVSQVLKGCEDGTVIRFEEGEYHFWPEQAYEKYYYISNNRHGLKRVAFSIVGKKNIVIDGGGSRFIFHGEIVPFVVEDCAGITLRNFSVDWERPFYSQGEVVRSDERSVDLKIDRNKYPYHLEKDQIIFEGEGWARGFSEGLFEMDSSTCTPAYLSGDSMGAGIKSDWSVEEISNGVVRINESFPRPSKVGNTMLLRHYRRCCPGIHLKHSTNTVLEHITLHHAGGMGVISQFCENITLRNCTVTPSGDRLFSVTVDATHFVNCRGLIKIEECLFENQLDDPANIHGINSRVKEVLDEYSLVTELVHHEQVGVEIGFEGDFIKFSDNRTLLSYASNEIASIETCDERFSKITFKHPLPQEIQPDHVLENMSWVPDLHITGCTSRNNRARGYLISTSGSVVVENNKIESSGAGIKISGDANHWFESGAVRDVLIRNNEFGDCCYGAPTWGRAVIDIDPEISDPWKNAECFHRNIRIENNRFFTFDVGILFARSVDGIRFAGNTVRRTENYPMTQRMEALLTFEACRNIRLEENTIDGIMDTLICENEAVKG